MDDAYQLPAGVGRGEDQLQGTPVQPGVGGIQAGKMKLNETAAGVCLGQIFQSVAALQNTVHSDLRGLGVVGIEHIGGEIFGWSQLDQAAQAVGHAPGVHRLISGELPDLSGSEAEVAVPVNSGIGRKGNALLRVDESGQSIIFPLLYGADHCTGRAEQGKVVAGIERWQGICRAAAGSGGRPCGDNNGVDHRRGHGRLPLFPGKVLGGAQGAHKKSEKEG